MSEGGRPRDPVWDYYSRHPIGKYHYGVCLTCTVQVAGKPHLLIKHLTTCLSQPAEVRQWAEKGWRDWREQTKRKSNPSAKPLPPPATSPIPSDVASSPPKQSRFTVASFPRVSIVEQVHLENQIMRFVIRVPSVMFSCETEPCYQPLVTFLSVPFPTRSS